MTLLGNIFLALATLFFFLTFSAVFVREQPRGDAVVGYTWGLVIFNLLFLACMIVVAISIGSKGGFGWISPGKTTRFLLVSLGLLSAVFTVAISALFKHEPGPVSPPLRFLSSFAPALITILMILGSAVLINNGLRESIPAALYKVPLVLVFGLGIMGVCISLFSWISFSNQNTKRQLEEISSDQVRLKQNHLDNIDSCDVTKDIAHILVFTDANHDKEVRDRAVAKVKTNSLWQQELCRLLENNGAIEAFNFLASNEVEDKNLFIKPVNTGIVSIAEWIKRQIQNASHPSHFYPEEFSWEVDRALRTAEKFEGLGMDYLPAVREMRAALDEVASVEKTEFKCAWLLDKWIKKRGSN